MDKFLICLLTGFLGSLLGVLIVLGVNGNPKSVFIDPVTQARLNVIEAQAKLETAKLELSESLCKEVPKRENGDK